MVGQFPIEDVPPALDDRPYPTRAIVEKLVLISPYFYRYGYDEPGLRADRHRALVSAWCEKFPRLETADLVTDHRHV
jgi:hypothetical protein